MALLAFGTLGIVFGDIGTSPIYAFRETFHHADLEVTQATAFGAASVAFWALVIVICLKYLATVMRADNHGEGGILALTSLVIPPEGQTVSRVAAGVVTLGVFGTALLYGDGLITPAISVLSAVEGFEVATPAFKNWIIPIAVLILIVLFVIQRRGTAGIAKVFSPIMVVWFTVLGVLGVNQIRQAPERHVNALELGIFVEAVAAQFATKAALLVPADRQFWCPVDDTIDPAATGANAADALHRIFEIGRPHRGGKAELAGIGECDGFVRVPEGH